MSDHRGPHHEPYPLLEPPECPRCGQKSSDRFTICDPCRAGDRADQGAQDRLFTPTAAPIAGQIGLEIA